MAASDDAGSHNHKKGKWSSEEDTLLKEYVAKQGEGKWDSVAQNSGLQRTASSCRLRWINHLNPGVNHRELTAKEREKIIRLHYEMGNKWSMIASEIPGRTDDQIKSFCKLIARKTAKLMMGSSAKSAASSSSSHNNIQKDIFSDLESLPELIKEVMKIIRSELQRKD